MRGGRWLLLLVFAVGATVEPLRAASPLFVWLNAVAACATALLLTRLGRPAREVLWAWVVLAVFVVGYFLKSYIIGSDVERWRNGVGLFDELTAVLTLDLVSRGFGVVTLAFVTFCVAAWVVIGRADPPSVSSLSLPSATAALGPAAAFRAGIAGFDTRRLGRLILSTGTAMLGLTLLRAAFGVGVHGLEGASAADVLPFRLGTFIVRGEEVLATVAFLCIWAADASGRRGLLALAIGTAALNTLAISVVTTSRSALLGLALPIGFLWLVSGRLTRGRMLVIGGFGATFLAVFPFLDALRYARVANVGDLGASIALARTIVGDFGVINSIALALAAFVFRIIGADGIWMSAGLLDFSFSRLHRILFSDSLVGYYTTTVVGTLQERTFRSPGLVGAFVLLGGTLAVVPLVWTTVWALRRTWGWLGRLECAPAALALGAMFVFGLVNEGTFYPQNIIGFFVSVVICNWLTVHVLRMRRVPTPEAARANESSAHQKASVALGHA